jgi:hypothetical protein
MKMSFVIRLVATVLTVPVTLSAQADLVSYAADFETSRLNPVTEILILERDTAGIVHGTVYPTELPGTGGAVIVHDPAFTPVHSLVIGLTEGEDEEGNPKTQLVMFVADDFAVDNEDVKFSEAFPGARHSITTSKLQEAWAGDAAQLAWFTDTFFSGPAAEAVFDSYGSFSVAEFTVLTTIGNAVTSGTWVQNQAIQYFPEGDPNGQNGLATAVIDETATNAGPYDIQVEINGFGSFAMDKSVLNGSGGAFDGFTLEVGTGLGPNFVPTANSSNLRFDREADTLETTGAFPDMVFGTEQISFGGLLPQGDTAHFIFFISTNTEDPHNVTVRQRGIGAEPRATFNVAKFFSDDNPTPVEVTISCTTGLPLEQTKLISQGGPVEFVVVDFDGGEMDCDITEAVPPGYSENYESNGGVDSDNQVAACRYEDVSFGGNFICVISNTLEQVRVDVRKLWYDDHPEFNRPMFARARWNCESGNYFVDEPEFFGCEGDVCGSLQFYGADSTDSFYVYPHWNGSTYCWVDEHVFESGVVSDAGDCSSLIVSPGAGNACTITNTRFYEGIPTLSQYGLATLALLMLGVGLIGFRRFT